MRTRQDRRLVRRDEQWLTLPNPWDVPVDICADERVPLEPAAVDEVLSVLETADTLARLAEAVPGHDGPPPRLIRLVLTPDFHKGAGIPIGTVIETEGALLPQAVGNDVNCGMRLEVTSLTVEQVRPRLDALERRLGNHFAELQYVARVHDPAAAYAWGLTAGAVVLMVHSGSLALGHQANATALDRLRQTWPPGLSRPRNQILPFLLDERTAAARRRYLDAFGNAANFASGNRFFLALTMRAGLAAECGQMTARLVYDAPHNLFWQEEDRVIHRKGATPAGGHKQMTGGPYAMWGEPVIVPGSMGASSYLLRGHGNARTLASACHGAGRRVPRGATARAGDHDLDAFLRDFRVVTPLDHRDPTVARRADVMAAWRRDLKQEAPWAYKDIGPVVSSLHAGGVSDPVAELRPLLTVKG